MCNAPVRRIHENQEVFDARRKVYENITGCMKEYCKPGLSEIERYPAFVNLSNAALELVGADNSPLKDLLRRPDNTRILFHINHPQPVILRIDQSDITRYPDIVIVAEESVKKAFNASNMSRSQLLDLAATPTNRTRKINRRTQFPVAALLSYVEFKKKKDMAPPPDAWSTDQEPHFADPKTIDDMMQGWAEHVSFDTHEFPEKSAAASKESTGSTPGVTTPSTSAGLPSIGQKRKAAEDEIDFDPRETNHQRTAYNTAAPVYLPIVLSASYALLSLNRAAGVLKVISMFVEDRTLWLWIYDRQGAIQSYGLDFIQDFPRFVALLAAFQRFSRQDWGFNPELEPPEQVDPTSPVQLTFTTPATPTTPTYTYTVTLTKEIVYERPTFRGRATRVETVTVERDVEGFNVENDEFVLKIGWPETTRTSEVKIIAAAHEIADREVENEHYITGHLPEVVCSKDLPKSYATGAIRNALGLLPGQTPGGSRTCRLIVFVKLREITNLLPLRFLRIFTDVVDCHYYLWINGIKHCDISLRNLMWHPRRCRGVLNDFDLSRMDSEVQPKNLERTGTVPFLSLDILSNPDFQNDQGLVDVIYKHDCDSLKWVFLYVCCIDTPNSAVLRWFTNDPVECLRVKGDFLLPPLGDGKHFKVSDKYETLRSRAISVFRNLHNDFEYKWLARDRHLAHLQDIQAVTDERTVEALDPWTTMVLTGKPTRKREPPKPLEEPEEEPAPLSVEPEELYDAFRNAVYDVRA